MTRTTFKILVSLIGIGFAVAFGILVIPPLLDSGDVLGAFAGGFVNPYASGYALDAILTWCVLAVWVIYEAGPRRRVKHGWVALVLGVVPGVATGLAAYLLIRSRRTEQTG